jgi:23S rRNA G2445 N2-methylase RlmL
MLVYNHIIMEYIAFVTKGLEEISVKEIQSLGKSEILSVKQKIIRFKSFNKKSDLKSLKTVDDIGIFISEMPVKELLDLNLEREQNDIREAVDVLKKDREVKEEYSLTISKYKNNDVSESELKDILVPYFTEKLNFKYTPLDHSNLDIRINIVEKDCFLTVKLFSQSLFRRDYGHETLLGSLRSTIAASMLYKLTEGKGGFKIIDNFCGSGTFLCEALIMGNKVFGNDIDKGAVIMTIKNLNKVKSGDYEVSNLDAENTKWRNNEFDIAVSNFPWNKQIKVNKMSKIIAGSVKEYHRIVKANSKLGFITTKPEIVIKYLKKYFEIKDLQKYKIGYLGQVPTIILVEVDKN